MPKFDDFSQLLDKNLNEQEYQNFLEQNTEFIPREFVQNHGIQFSLVLRKLSLAKDYISDFFYLSKSTTKWHCIFVELEKPSSRYFKDGTTELHRDFVKAHQQVKLWQAWFQNPSNSQHFIDNTISILKTPLERNPCEFKYILVLGRRDEYSTIEKKRNIIKAHEDLDFKIMSFDSLAEDIKRRQPLYVGVRKNDYIEIHSKKFVSENIFSWLHPDCIRINEELRQDILRNKDKWCSYEKISEPPLLETKLPKIKNF